jgi:hypothetical protein
VKGLFEMSIRMSSDLFIGYLTTLFQLHVIDHRWVRIWKYTVEACFKVLAYHSPGETQVYHGNLSFAGSLAEIRANVALSECK